MPLAGALAGLAGVLLLAGPFLRETAGNEHPSSAAVRQTLRYKQTRLASSKNPDLPSSWRRLAVFFWRWRGFIVIVARLRASGSRWNPFAFVHVFEGDYLAGFLLILGGVARCSLHRKIRRVASSGMEAHHLLGCGIRSCSCAAADLCLARSDAQRSMADAGAMAAVPCLIALRCFRTTLPEELLLGPATRTRSQQGSARPMPWRFAALPVGRSVRWNSRLSTTARSCWCCSRPIFALFCLFQRTGMDVVRKSTGSPWRRLSSVLYSSLVFAVVVFPIS